MSGTACLMARTAFCANPSGLNASLAHNDLACSGVTGKSAMAGIPSATSSCASLTNRSIDNRLTLGIEGMASI